MTFELMARCPHCLQVRLLWGPHRINSDADFEAAEMLVDIKGNASAHCPTCNRIEEVAMFVYSVQTEPWLDAEEYERRNGPGAGPLPPKPKIGG